MTFNIIIIIVISYNNYWNAYHYIIVSKLYLFTTTLLLIFFYFMLCQESISVEPILHNLALVALLLRECTKISHFNKVIMFLDVSR